MDTEESFLFSLMYLIEDSLSVSLQGADHHVNTSTNVHAAAAERRGTRG